MAPGKLFHSIEAETINARSAVESCALDLVAGTVSLLMSDTGLKPGLVGECLFSNFC